MKIFVALIRGINVGSHKKFTKAEQLAMAQRLGLQKIEIYLHTGNWVFRSKKSPKELEEIISAEINETFGWEVPVVVKGKNHFENIFNACPFTSEKKEKSYFILLKTEPSPEKIEAVQDFSTVEEEFYITPYAIYIYYFNGAGRAKLSSNFFENKLKVQATARNYNTMTKLLSLLKNG